MAGRIREDDIALVRERARIDEVVSAHVTLRNAGGGSMKGLCPFHDEKSPSFQVTPSRGFFHCFGCQEGGDVFTFVQKIDGVGFSEAVERLAGRYGVLLRYVDDRRVARPPEARAATRASARGWSRRTGWLPTSTPRSCRRPRRCRAGSSSTSVASTRMRRPCSGSASRHAAVRLCSATSARRASPTTSSSTAGLVARNDRGPYDRFRGRLLWPIRELSGDVVGFGARRLFDDDRVEAKYLNTPETPIYKKSQLLYGVDLARKEIARSSQAVVVEGYTDVMACHLSGVKTAVATCGTAFGEDHTRILRRLMLDHDEFRGEVIFTFDGDAAGQKAALRAFQGDQQFVGQTYVAVEPGGHDPCELRLAEGDAAVRELIARRVPLYRFVLRNVVSRYDLDRADSRVDAVREAARLVASIRDKSKVEAFARELAGMVGVDIDDSAGRGRRRTTGRVGRGRLRHPRGRCSRASASPTKCPTRPSAGSRSSGTC